MRRYTLKCEAKQKARRVFPWHPGSKKNRSGCVFFWTPRRSGSFVLLNCMDKIPEGSRRFQSFFFWRFHFCPSSSWESSHGVFWKPEATADQKVRMTARRQTQLGRCALCEGVVCVFMEVSISGGSPNDWLIVENPI